MPGMAATHSETDPRVAARIRETQSHHAKGMDAVSSATVRRGAAPVNVTLRRSTSIGLVRPAPGPDQRDAAPSKEGEGRFAPAPGARNAARVRATPCLPRRGRTLRARHTARGAPLSPSYAASSHAGKNLALSAPSRQDEPRTVRNRHVPRQGRPRRALHPARDGRCLPRGLG